MRPAMKMKGIQRRFRQMRLRRAGALGFCGSQVKAILASVSIALEPLVKRCVTACCSIPLCAVKPEAAPPTARPF